jgi:hypothetical protein
MYDANKQQTEFGIDPDMKVDLTNDITIGSYRDDIIEAARQLLVK